MICDGCFLKKAARVKSHRWEPHCSWDRGLFFFFPFPSPNRPLLCQLACSLCSCSSLAWAVDKRGPYSYWRQCCLCSWKGQNSNMKSLVCLLNLLYVGEKPYVHTTGISKGQRMFLYWSVVGQILQLPVGFMRRISMFISDGNELDQCFLWISLVKTTSLPKDQVT